MKRRHVRGGSSALSSNATSSAASYVDDHKEKGKVVLLKYEALPEYLKDNEYIRNYYRCEWPLKNVLLSVFSLHNETLNIWTHLVGFMIFTAMMIMSLNWEMSVDNMMATLFGEGSELKTSFNQTNNSSANFFTDSYTRDAPKSPIYNPQTVHSNPIPLWPWFVFLFGAMTCLIFSASSHLFASHSRRFYFFFWRLDYTGISLMIVCSFFAPIYYTFLERPMWRYLYLSSITLVGIFVLVTLLAPALSSSRFRAFRAALFLCMGFSGIVPATHALVLHWEHPQILASLGCEILMGVLYGVGAVFYVTRIPERWRPGAFDIVGHSHQIFHVFVVAAALTHSAATLVIMEWRRDLVA